MQTVTKRLSVFTVAFLATQISVADTLTHIFESALQNDPVLRAARASFQADRENSNIARGALLPNSQFPLSIPRQR